MYGKYLIAVHETLTEETPILRAILPPILTEFLVHCPSGAIAIAGEFAESAALVVTPTIRRTPGLKSPGILFLIMAGRAPLPCN